MRVGSAVVLGERAVLTTIVSTQVLYVLDWLFCQWVVVAMAVLAMVVLSMSAMVVLTINSMVVSMVVLTVASMVESTNGCTGIACVGNRCNGHANNNHDGCADIGCKPAPMLSSIASAMAELTMSCDFRCYDSTSRGRVGDPCFEPPALKFLL